MILEAAREPPFTIPHHHQNFEIFMFFKIYDAHSGGMKFDFPIIFNVVRSTLLRPGWGFSPSGHFGYISPKKVDFHEVFRVSRAQNTRAHENSHRSNLE